MPEPSRQTLSMPQPQRAQSSPPQPQQAKVTEAAPRVTYLPGDGDPAVTKYRGITFKAHQPTEVTKEIVDAVRGNRFFQIGDEPVQQAATDLPKTHEQYRAWVINWMKDVSTVRDLIRHWTEDQSLRHTCEVGSDDMNYLGTIIAPKVEGMRRSEGLSEQQLANLWIQAGVFELPWRS